jgi:hypothetical protein
MINHWILGKFRPNNMLSASMRMSPHHILNICQMYKVRCRRCSLQAFVLSLGRKHLLRPPLLPRLRSVSVLSVGCWGLGLFLDFQYFTTSCWVLPFAISEIREARSVPGEQSIKARKVLSTIIHNPAFRFSTLGLLSCAQWKSTIAICRRIRRVVTPEAARSCLAALWHQVAGARKGRFHWWLADDDGFFLDYLKIGYPSEQPMFNDQFILHDEIEIMECL